MNRKIHSAVLAVLAAACGLAAPLPIGSADARESDAGPVLVARGGVDGRQAQDKKKKKTAEQKLLEQVAEEFRRRDHEALAARMPGGKNKVSLRLGNYRGNKERDEAKGALETWFKNKEIVSVKLTTNSGLVGDFALRIRRTGTDTIRDRTLRISLAKRKTKDVEKIVLVRIEVHGD